MPNETIFIVDPDNVSLNFLVRKVQEERYAAVGFDSGKEGLIAVWQNQPDLIIFDPALQDISPEEFLLKLRRDARSANLPVLALSSARDPEMKEACLQAGCNEYIPKSGEAVAALPQAILRLLGQKQDQIQEPELRQEQEPVIEPTKEKIKTGGYLIVFLSAKGGTGTSSLCANYAMTIRHLRPKASVVVVDMVLPIGSIAPIVGYEGDIDLVSVAALPSEQTTGRFFPSNLPELDLWEFQLLAGATDPEAANNLKVGRIPEIIDVLQAAYDYVVIDLGRSLSRISMPIIQDADLLVLTMSTDQSTITLTKKVWDYLHAQGIEPQNIFAILNRAVGLEGLTKAEAEEILGFPIKAALPYMGSNFVLANNLNQPIILKYPDDTSAIIFKDTTNNMIELAEKLRDKQNV